ncbi:TSHSV-HP8 [Trionyx sinensis hemorrhagic syndrome virus]|uniref:TSHSV-HP8 n=1 Tax=Trionyx sinensis hemorrhagic syndrome virus TaxID=1705352 RepID=A0AAE7J192_9NIDO|nr:TSHSV-HP8 [Trionyx sinensis hemorrhagic syndrome virus]QNI38739.1 TSHSV-HP8 [Trionyx sinensis hemorrhagic syndrome virus]
MAEGGKLPSTHIYYPDCRNLGTHCTIHEDQLTLKTMGRRIPIATPTTFKSPLLITIRGIKVGLLPMYCDCPILAGGKRGLKQCDEMFQGKGREFVSRYDRCPPGLSSSTSFVRRGGVSDMPVCSDYLEHKISGPFGIIPETQLKLRFVPPRVVTHPFFPEFRGIGTKYAFSRLSQYEPVHSNDLILNLTVTENYFQHVVLTMSSLHPGILHSMLFPTDVMGEGLCANYSIRATKIFLCLHGLLYICYPNCIETDQYWEADTFMFIGSCTKFDVSKALAGEVVAVTTHTRLVDLFFTHVHEYMYYFYHLSLACVIIVISLAYCKLVMFLMLILTPVATACQFDSANYTTLTCVSNSYYHIRGEFQHHTSVTGDLSCSYYCQNSTLLTYTCCNNTHNHHSMFPQNYWNGSAFQNFSECAGNGEVVGTYCTSKCFVVEKLSDGSMCRTHTNGSSVCSNRTLTFKVPYKHGDFSQSTVKTIHFGYEVQHAPITHRSLETVEQFTAMDSSAIQQYVQAVESVNVTDAFRTLNQLAPFWLAAVYSSLGFNKMSGTLPLTVNLRPEYIEVVNCLTMVTHRNTLQICSNGTIYVCIPACYVFNSSNSEYVTDTKLMETDLQCSGENVSIINDTIIGHSVSFQQHKINTVIRPLALKIYEFVLDYSVYGMIGFLALCYLISFVFMIWLFTAKVLNAMILPFFSSVKTIFQRRAEPKFHQFVQ